MPIHRRAFLKGIVGVAGAASLGPLAGCGSAPARGGASPKVVVVGAGFGGATFARYLKRWAPRVEITLIEPNPRFHSGPLSNRVLAGIDTMEGITLPYANLRKAVDAFVEDRVVAVDSARRTVTTQGGSRFAYDKLILAGGVELMFDKLRGYDGEARKTIKHAWQAGPDETGTLRAQLEAIPDGGTFVMSVPPAPYRCPSAPYERACLVAHYFKKAKPRSKVIILDANPDIPVMKGLFLAAWKRHYGFDTPDGMIDWRANTPLRAVDAGRMMASTEFDDLRADVINAVPPMRAAAVCALAGVRVGADGREGPWCSIDPRGFESTAVKHIHILGDSALTDLPKTASMANNMAKLCAYVLSEQFAGRPADPAPVLANTCYSASTGNTAFHVATVFRWDEGKKALLPDKGANGVSPYESEQEFAHMEAWTKNVWADTLGL